jgi:hypothetical protein
MQSIENKGLQGGPQSPYSKEYSRAIRHKANNPLCNPHIMAAPLCNPLFSMLCIEDWGDHYMGVAEGVSAKARGPTF